MAEPGNQRTSSISVVIPTRNRAAMLAAALASVFASALISIPTQVIVVDDDSTDDTEAVAQRFGATYLRVDYHSPSQTRNAGLELVATPYITFLDDDDVWRPGNMEPQLAALEADPGAAFAYGMAQGATEQLQSLEWTFPSPPLARGRDPERLYLGFPQLGVVLFRTAAVAGAGGFDAAIPYYQDADLMIRLAAARPVIGLEFVGMLHRVRTPSRASADYFWKVRDVTTWKPHGVGVSWLAFLRFERRTRGLFFSRFLEAANASSRSGKPRDALVCIGRAIRVSPLHALRRPALVASALRAMAGAISSPGSLETPPLT